MAELAHRAAAAVAERMGPCDFVVSPDENFHQWWIPFKSEDMDSAVKKLADLVEQENFRRFAALEIPRAGVWCGFANERGVWVRATAREDIWTEKIEMRLDVLGAA